MRPGRVASRLLLLLLAALLPSATPQRQRQGGADALLGRGRPQQGAATPPQQAVASGGASSSTPQQIPWAGKKLAVMVEYRHRGLTIPVLHNFEAHLSKDWNFAIVHGFTTRDYLATSPFVKHLVKAGRMMLIESHLTLTKPEPKSNMEYSAMLRAPAFWERLQAEHILIFQSDAAMCKETDLADWLKYDYVGAPWARPPSCHGFGPIKIGNGGLSLRRRSAMLRILAAEPVPDMGPHQPEDVFFGCMALHLNMSLPSAAEAETFAMEQIGNPKALGFHQITNQMGGHQAAAAARAANCTAYQSLFLGGQLARHLFLRRRM